MGSKLGKTWNQVNYRLIRGYQINMGNIVNDQGWISELIMMENIQKLNHCEMQSTFEI